MSSIQKEFIFHIFLHNRFPFEQPQIFLNSDLLFPSINQHCDLTKDILKNEWKPMVTMCDIVKIKDKDKEVKDKALNLLTFLVN